jgi:RimJ/RimL family protein N-acetyltransferase
VSPKAQARLTLRPLEASDVADLREAIDVSRPQLKRRFVWDAADADEEKFVARCAEAEAREEELVRGARAVKTGQLIGVGALQRLAGTMGVAELSFWVRSDKTDKGYAQEIGRGMAELAFKRRIHRLWVRLDPTNRAARQVLKRLKFKYEGRLRREKRLNGRWIDQECWGLLKEDL